MVDKMYTNIFMFLVICVFIYFIFSNLNTIEGMTTKKPISLSEMTSNTKLKPKMKTNTAENHSALIKTETIKIQDELSINKNKKNYEDTIIATDDLINLLMLKTVINLDKSNPIEGLSQLATLNQSKVALNSVMKYIDDI
jgi:hypothetical protein